MMEYADFSIHVPLVDEAYEGLPGTLPRRLKDTFEKDGFVVIPHVFDQPSVDALNDRLEQVLRGRYDRYQAPDKAPRLIKSECTPNDDNPEIDPAVDRCASDGEARRKDATVKADSSLKKRKKGATRMGPLGFSGNLNNVRVLQVINVHKSDRLFRKLAISPQLGKVVAELAGWKQGARLAQDQVWAKPPGAAPLVFHRDSPYFMFTPNDVVTVWIALDDMDKEIGPLEYVRGSHLWGDGRVGSANQFFQSDGGHALLRSAADRAGVATLDVVSMAGLRAGGISIHDGRTWHGSGKNESNRRPRRGLGLHFVPAHVRFTKEAAKSRLWRSYLEGVEDVANLRLPDEDFPLVWQPC